MPDNPKMSRQVRYRNSQVFGCDQSSKHVDPEDIITQIEFDKTGEYLALGDNAGRIIIFKEPGDEGGELTASKQFEYYSEFQSHQPEFDSLKSMTISESIKNISWLRPQGKYNKMITANSNRIKLWKLFEKEEKRVILSGERKSQTEIMIPQLNKEKAFTSNTQFVFPIRHSGSINHVQVTDNEHYVFSTDEHRAFLWDLERYQHPFTLYECPKQGGEGSNKSTGSLNSWKAGEEIKCSRFHPRSDCVFAIATNKARVEMSDLRVSINSRNNIFFNSEPLPSDKVNYFTEMTNSVGSLDFVSGGKYLVSRDYLGIKVWDLAKPDKPLKQISTNDMLQEKLCHLFENDCMEDCFKINSLGDSVISGTYDNRFNVIDVVTGDNIEYKLDFNHHLSKPPNDSKSFVTDLNREKSHFRGQTFDHNKKVLANGVHKASNRIALATLNSFFIYSRC